VTEGTAEDPDGAAAERIGDAAGNAKETPVRYGQLRAPRRWEQLLVEAAVIGSRNRWRRRLEGLANELRARLAELSDEEETEAAAVARMLEDLAVFTAYALPVIDLLDAWPSFAN
jgi:ATP-dependent helicase/nuclease subunit B